MFGKFRFHESFIACGMENFKGNMNGNHLKLPPTISEGSEEQNSYSNQYKTNLKQQNVANNRRINNNKRRPLRTLQQLENSMEASMSPRDMDNDRNNRNGVGVSMDTRFGDRSGTIKFFVFCIFFVFGNDGKSSGNSRYAFQTSIESSIIRSKTHTFSGVLFV